MMPTFQLCWLGLFAVVYTGTCFSLSQDGDQKSANEHSRIKRGGWSMFRLGRGLQMLRLGKRGFPTINAEDELTPQELRYLLASIVEEDSKSRRQVPVPRYGKDLDFQTAYEQTIADEEQKLIRRSGTLDSEGIDTAGHIGRFRRSTLRQYQNILERLSQHLHQVTNQERAVALPRIGRLTHDRAVPNPRIG